MPPSPSTLSTSRSEPLGAAPSIAARRSTEMVGSVGGAPKGAWARMVDDGACVGSSCGAVAAASSPAMRHQEPLEPRPEEEPPPKLEREEDEEKELREEEDDEELRVMRGVERVKLLR